ncbi:Hexaprenyldihydroxybenzoate methyltransferase, mitochondrial [Knufia obscura]|uniref:Ubiquinone biosynthesis O-methyltransferase, mitochondrial n=2 Tax=Knufia TaxID=430999 RepID=A0AAN8ES03_9EURO|nr:Hexaprenyldihydroxybenzoate methyltransferase, mitochondrial [Knufia obscura]KAK5950923.1 Hexaprenyldihydroxybenzoate methyltransferase, mitochondrial [Knufia fluminis]
MSRALRTAVLPLRQIWPRQTSGRAVQSVVHTSTTRLYSTTSSLHNTTGPSGNNSSVSALEVTHFTNLASSWWDPHGPSRLLHLMNPLRHDFIRSCQFTSAEGTVDAGESERAKYTYLDIGCGGGIFASSAARLPGTASVTAIDPTPEVIKVAKEHQRGDPLLSQKGRLNYVNCAIEDLSSHTEARDGFDFVTLFEVIEHIDKPSTFLRQALNHLKPGGWLIGSTIARHPVSYLTTKVIAEAPWPIGVVPRGTHDWDKYINPSELKGWFTKENREARARGEEDVYGTVKVEGCLYLPLVGWKFVNRSEKFGNYFFGVQKLR